MDASGHKGDDELGFSIERMLAGEASADTGRTRSLAEAMQALRARFGGQGGRSGL